jgi:hypothetical protein
MAVVMRMDWPEVTPEQYEQARAMVHWEHDVPDGAIFHVAFFDADGFKVVDVWESAQDFDNFLLSRLGPAIEQIGIEGQPNVEFIEAQAVFNPQALAAARA